MFISFDMIFWDKNLSWFLTEKKKSVLGNEVFTRHDLNYRQIRYTTLVAKLIDFTTYSRTFVWHLFKKWLNQKLLQIIKNPIWHNKKIWVFLQKKIYHLLFNNIWHHFSTKVDTASVQTRMGKWWMGFRPSMLHTI